MPEPTSAARPPSAYEPVAASDPYVSSRPPTLSGLNEDEAKSFHRMFITSFLVFTLIAAVAHYAVWQWRPWIPGVAGYSVPAQTTTGATR